MGGRLLHSCGRPPAICSRGRKNIRFFLLNGSAVGAIVIPAGLKPLFEIEQAGGEVVVLPDGIYPLQSSCALLCLRIFNPFTRKSEVCPCGQAMLLVLLAVMRRVPFHLPKANITHEARITSEGHITFRASGTHRSKSGNLSTGQITAFCWGEIWDSNPRPSGPQPDALTNCANPSVWRWRALGDSNPRPTA